MADDLSDLFQQHSEKVKEAERRQSLDRDAAKKKADVAYSMLAQSVEPIFHEAAESIRKNGYQADVAGPTVGSPQPVLTLTFVPVRPQSSQHRSASTLMLQLNVNGVIGVSVTAVGSNRQRLPEAYEHDPRFSSRLVDRVDPEWVRALVRAFVAEVLSVNTP